MSSNPNEDAWGPKRHAGKQKKEHNYEFMWQNWCSSHTRLEKVVWQACLGMGRKFCIILFSTPSRNFPVAAPYPHTYTHTLNILHLARSIWFSVNQYRVPWTWPLQVSKKRSSTGGRGYMCHFCQSLYLEGFLVFVEQCCDYCCWTIDPEGVHSSLWPVARGQKARSPAL